MSKRFKSNFTFGGSVAESDHLLSSAYWDNGDFDAIESHEDRRCFLIGRTGSGKSAAFQRLIEKYPQKVIRIDPENLSLPYILNIDAIHKMLDLGVHIETFMTTLWKHVIVVEILRHRYIINTPEQKQNILQSLMDNLKRDPAKIKALQYLDQFGDKFWCETDERVKQIADTLVQKIGATGGLDASISGIGIKGSGNMEETLTQESKQEIAAKYQRLINETQLPRLNEMLVILNNEILDSKQHFTYLVIDDLDKEWIDEKLANLLIRCLFQTVVDLQKVTHLKILIALRTNIFQQLNYGKQSRGGQEEKFRVLSLNLRWTINDLQNLLNIRADAASQYYQIDPPKSLSEMLPPVNKRSDNALSYILGHTLMRPRDAILFLNSAVREASGKDRITWDNIHVAEKTYSKERLLALRDEWKDPYLDIDKVLEKFRHKTARLSRDNISLVIDDITMVLAERDFLGQQWLEPICEPLYAAGSTQKTWFEQYGKLINLLYNISFIGIVKGGQGRASYSYENTESILHTSNLPENISFEIHPAFHRALDIVEEH